MLLRRGIKSFYTFYHSRQSFCSTSKTFIKYVSPRMIRDVKTQIELNETELKIRNLLVDFCDDYNRNSNGKSSGEFTLDLELRITGGWVRDKLLGVESNDIDIAINHMSGEEFATKLVDYLKETNPDLLLKAIHTIKKNPEKSKHLETCTTKLYGLDIDFVNLRSEQYTVDSRVPVMEYGTAEEDALRRDATLNALFYNLNQNCIEDLTGKGLDDLKNGILRTPLQPLQTFLDDPLRVLRLIRFASRLDCIIEENTLNSMKDPQLKSTLMTKISRERVGIELEKIFASNNPGYGLQLINYTGLTDSIFNTGSLHDDIMKLNSQPVLLQIEEISKQIEIQINGATLLFPIFKEFCTSMTSNSLKSTFTSTFSLHDLQKSFWLSIILSPYKLLAVRTSSKKNFTTHFPEILLREGLKSSKNDIEKVSVLTKQVDVSKDIFDRVFHSPESVTRSELGLYLKCFSSFSDLNILFNCFMEMVHEVNKNNNSTIYEPLPAIEYSAEDREIIYKTMTPVFEKYQFILNLIDSQGLRNAHLIKPIIDGKSLSKELGLKPGPWMGQINTQIMVWQLDNPEKSISDCLDYVKGIIHEFI